MRAAPGPCCWSADLGVLAMADGITEFALQFRLNGADTACRVPVQQTLADLLRYQLGLKGTKIGCSRGVCGACVALVDGEPVATCSTFSFQAHGCDVVSIEGLAHDGAPHAIQQAFIAHSAFQCGYCTAGMVLLAKALLDRHADPDRATIIEWLSSNVCRCTGYAQIIEAVEDAARRLRAEAAS